MILNLKSMFRGVTFGATLSTNRTPGLNEFRMVVNQFDLSTRHFERLIARINLVDRQIFSDSLYISVHYGFCKVQFCNQNKILTI